MGDALSQSDLDALFGDIAPAKNDNGGVSQSDLDALFGDLAPEKTASPEDADIKGVLEGLDLSQSGKEPTIDPGAGSSSSGSDNLSQDEIDALLKEFLG